ncbi:histone family protein DNA-binding protein [Thermodesulfobium narugense DSM 14796]|uniref:Histone family protein DNA-binding protein n=1 Tax=Thermodesulfobium narugense DSM 14796 TaxID=747365 RepID=M1E5M5_9BACT|nr:HU family DNA-binding protein [Thermodesulfobium narugense]AEE13778.1 histone family protein DNA-binding protein [Thermodesulfobium narugense DSM 14796]
MRKTDLINAVAEKCKGMTKKDCTVVVEAVFDSIKDALKRNEKVQLIGFGTFEVRERKERKGRNPRSKEEIVIPAMKTPGFKAGKALKEAVQPKKAEKKPVKGAKKK